MRRIPIIAALLVALSFSPTTPGKEWHPDATLETSPRRAVVEYSHRMDGTVVAIDRRSITLDVTLGQGLSRLGSPLVRGRVRFALSPDLAAGGRPGDCPMSPTKRPWCVAPNFQDRYRATDVQVGDRVSIECYVVDGTNTCYTIQIRRRPGGRVPPTDDVHLSGLASRHHEVMNAYQHFEELGFSVSTRELFEYMEQVRVAEREAKNPENPATRRMP